MIEKKMSLVILRKQTPLVLHRPRARGDTRLRSFAPDTISCIHSSRTVSAVDAPLFVFILRFSCHFFAACCSRIVCITRRRKKKKDALTSYTQYLNPYIDDA